VFRVVIPARHASTRLPGKPLLPLLGRPMIEWVYRRARRSGASEILIATDDRRILEAARGFGAAALLTAATHVSGSDRIAEVARRERWEPGDIVVNVQGDEPLLPAELITQVAELLEQHPDADLATLATPLTSVAQLLDPHIVKVVTDAQQRALYFSRAPIPWSRDGASNGTQTSFAAARRHLGLYAYRVDSLLRLAALPAGALEQLERLEQLRALENGLDIRVADAHCAPGPDVNTAADVAEVEALLAADPERP
jgi:3-deoxy-manno-octulosonate cytidylyltransferase (CMP-KDO synthetase)